jgi:hypothetical protein
MNIEIPYLEWLEPVLTVVIGVCIGFLFKTYLFSRLKNFSDKTSFKGDDVVVNAFNSMIVFWFFLASLSIALKNVELGDPYNVYASKLIFSFLVISMSLTVSKIVLGMLDVWAKNNSSLPSTGIFKGLVNVSIFSLAFLVVLQSFGISITLIMFVFFYTAYLIITTPWPPRPDPGTDDGSNGGCDGLRST